MRCPKCKTILLKGEDKKYETLTEHVFDPNAEFFVRPLRETWICPNQCLGESVFFSYDGAIYGSAGKIPANCFSALDSPDREISVGIALRSLGQDYKTYSRNLKDLIIEGERDIPSQWKWIFYSLFYFFRGQYLLLKYGSAGYRPGKG